MKKILLGLFIFGFFTIGSQVYAESVLTSLTVLSPIGGEIYQNGQSVVVKWKSVGYSSNSKIAIDLAATDSSGSSANTYLMSVNNLDDDGIETLTIPNSVKTGSNYVLMLTIFETSSKWQMAKSNMFTINPALNDNYSVRILSPNGGGVFTQGAENRISWSGGKNKIQIGLFSSSNQAGSYGANHMGIVGYIFINLVKGVNGTTGNWDAISLSDLNGSSIGKVTPGQYKIVAISESESGNYCLGDKNYCNSDLSDNFITIKPANFTCPTTGINPWSVCADGKMEAASRDANQCVTSYKCTNPKNDLGCKNNERYSSITEQLCSVDANTGCLSGQIYSSITGATCPKILEENAGCYGAKYSIITGKVCPLSMVTDEGCKIGQIFSSTTGQKCPVLVETKYSKYLLEQNFGSYKFTDSEYRSMDGISYKFDMYIARYSLDSNISSGGYQTDVSVYPTNTIAQKELNTYLNSTSNPFSNLTMSNGQTIYYNSGSSYHSLYYYMYSWISGNSLIVITKSSSSNENGASNDSLVLSYLNKYPTNIVIDTGCSNGQVYSSTTGQKCTASITPTNTARRTLRWGLSGDDVRSLQKNLGFSNTDGIYGTWTMAKVKEWQAKNGLNADGVFGPGSRSKMGL